MGVIGPIHKCGLSRPAGADLQPISSILIDMMQCRIESIDERCGVGHSTSAYQEMEMAKGQQRSGREPKKPKAEKPKPTATSSFADKQPKPKSGK
jgi:hypothetical protein